MDWGLVPVRGPAALLSTGSGPGPMKEGNTSILIPSSWHIKNLFNNSSNIPRGVGLQMVISFPIIKMSLDLENMF